MVLGAVPVYSIIDRFSCS